MPLMLSSWRGSQNLTLLNVRTVHKRNLKRVKVHIKKTPRKKVDNQKKAIKIPWSSLQNQLFSTIENEKKLQSFLFTQSNTNQSSCPTTAT